MSYFSDLQAHLKANAGLSALVSENIWPLFRRSDSLPAVTYQVVANVPQTGLDGGQGDLDNVRVQIDCWSSASYDQARQVAAAVRSAMSGFASKSILLLEQDFYESEPRMYRVSLDYSSWYRTA